MIQFKRGSTKNWRKLKQPLAAGQPGYDKDKHRIKIGDGESLWEALPYAGGVSPEDVLNSEDIAKIKHKKDPEDTPIITYGTETPDKNTVGQLYLQYYDTEPEVDYVVSSGVDGIWTYQIWKSGIVKCWGSYNTTITTQNISEEQRIFYSNEIKPQNYPISFHEAPVEVATIQSCSGAVAWLTGCSSNSETAAATYRVLSITKLSNLNCTINLNVTGLCK